jgi:DNA mismatch repair protein MutL
VNVHPAKTEVKFLNEKAVFDCIHYGVLGALNKSQDRPQVQLPKQPLPAAPAAQKPANQQNFFRTMNAAEYKTFTAAMQESPKPSPLAAAATAAAIERSYSLPLQQAQPVRQAPVAQEQTPEPEQQVMPMPQEQSWRLVGELYNSYILVEQEDNAFLIDKHAAHERILFEKLKANQETISGQTLLRPVPCRLNPECCAILLSNLAMLEELGFEIEDFGENTILVRQISMDLDPEQASETLEMLAQDLLAGRQENKDTVRDTLLHSVACKAAIKAGWRTDEQELRALVKQVMSRPDLQHCPHGRPICITLSKKQLERQFKRS